MGDSIYRVPAPKPPVPPDPYRLAWTSLRRRRLATWISPLAWLLVGGVAIRFLGNLALVVILPLMATCVAASLMATFFRCPHCRELFARESAFGISTPAELFVRCCVHCGIRVGTPRSAVVAETTADVLPDAERE